MGPMKLHQYQEDAVSFWLEHPRTYFAIDMGLGKTAIVLHTLVKLKQSALIVAPLRAAYSTWPEEVKKWDLPLSYTIVHGAQKKEALYQKTDLYITNFHSIPFIYDTLAQMSRKTPAPFSICVIDEGSMIKAHNTKRIKYLKAMRKLFPKYRAILSGTPAPNSLLDLWAQYDWLTDGEIFPRYSTFRFTYYDNKPYNPYVFTLKPHAATEIYKKVAPYTYRLDEKDYAQLPDISYNYITAKLPEKLKAQYKELEKEFVLEIQDITCRALSTASLSMKLRQFLQGFLYYYPEDGSPRQALDLHTLKIDLLKSLVEETAQPILCAIQFKYEFEMLNKVFPGAPIIAGRTSSKDANKYIQQWNAREIPLMFCHPASISHGVNLQSGGNIIAWYCQTWSLEQYLQFNKRVHRQGQKNGVIIHHITIQDTIDDRVTRVLKEKDFTQQKLLDFLKEYKGHE